MIMIDVLNMMAKGEIKDKTELFVYDHIECIDIYTFDGKAFYNEHGNEIGSDFIISSMFLNYTVELVEPIPKKYCVLDSTGGYFKAEHGYIYIRAYLVERK